MKQQQDHIDALRKKHEAGKSIRQQKIKHDVFVDLGGPSSVAARIITGGTGTGKGTTPAIMEVDSAGPKIPKPARMDIDPQQTSRPGQAFNIGTPRTNKGRGSSRSDPENMDITQPAPTPAGTPVIQQRGRSRSSSVAKTPKNTKPSNNSIRPTHRPASSNLTVKKCDEDSPESSSKSGCSCECGSE
jgi:hypothetical protein